MNFINDRELARRFKTGDVPSRERFYYLLIQELLMMLITSSFFVHFFYLDEPLTYWDKASDIIMLLFALFGTIVLYRVNAQGDGKEFIERYVCISFPVTMQFALLAFIGFLLMVAVDILGVISIQDLPDTEFYFFGFLATFFLLLYVYYRLYRSIKIASH